MPTKEHKTQLKKVEHLSSYNRVLRRKRGLKDLYFFNREILEEGHPERQQNIVPHVHGEWWDWLSQYKKRLKMLLVPRSTLKSTFITVGGSLQDIAKNKQTRILIANATLGNSQKFLGEIKDNLENNEYFKELYGNLSNKGGKWTETEIIVKGRGRGVREPTVSAVGVGGNLVSQHYNLIFWDDLVNEQNVYTRDQALKVIDWWKRSISLLDPDGSGILIGTRWSHFELYQYVIDELQEDVDVFIRGAYNEDGSTYYPEMLSQKKLAQLRRLEGSYTFSSFYLNNPVDSENVLIKQSEIHYYGGECPCGDIHRLPSRGELSVFVACDPAFSQSQRADFSAIVTVGVDQDNCWWVLETKHGRWRVDELIARLFDTYKRWTPDSMSLEVLSAAQSLIHAVHNESAETGVFLPLREIKSKGGMDKQGRLRAVLQPRFQQTKVFVKQDQIELVDELTRYPNSKHDDVIDALADISEICFAPNRVIETEGKIPVTIQERIQAQHARREDELYFDEVLGSVY